MAMRVLIIEDNSDLAANIHDFLENGGHTPDAAGDGITGLHLAVTQPYEAIILDLTLPGMDGLTPVQEAAGGGRQEYAGADAHGEGHAER